MLKFDSALRHVLPGYNLFLVWFSENQSDLMTQRKVDNGLCHTNQIKKTEQAILAKIKQWPTRTSFHMVKKAAISCGDDDYKWDHRPWNGTTNLLKGDSSLLRSLLH